MYWEHQVSASDVRCHGDTDGCQDPSPIQAQKYRVENLYEGPIDNERAEAPKTRADSMLSVVFSVAPLPQVRRCVFRDPIMNQEARKT